MEGVEILRSVHEDVPVESGEKKDTEGRHAVFNIFTCSLSKISLKKKIR